MFSWLSSPKHVQSAGANAQANVASGKGANGASKPTKQAFLGEKENKFYYDEQLKRWRVEGEEEDDADEQVLNSPPRALGIAQAQAQAQAHPFGGQFKSNVPTEFTQTMQVPPQPPEHPQGELFESFENQQPLAYEAVQDNPASAYGQQQAKPTFFIPGAATSAMVESEEGVNTTMATATNRRNARARYVDTLSAPREIKKDQPSLHVLPSSSSFLPSSYMNNGGHQKKEPLPIPASVKMFMPGDSNSPTKCSYSSWTEDNSSYVSPNLDTVNGGTAALSTVAPSSETAMVETHNTEDQTASTENLTPSIMEQNVQNDVDTTPKYGDDPVLQDESTSLLNTEEVIDHTPYTGYEISEGNVEEDLQKFSEEMTSCERENTLGIDAHITKENSEDHFTSEGPKIMHPFYSEDEDANKLFESVSTFDERELEEYENGDWIESKEGSNSNIYDTLDQAGHGNNNSEIYVHQQAETYQGVTVDADLDWGPVHEGPSSETVREESSEKAIVDGIRGEYHKNNGTAESGIDSSAHHSKNEMHSNNFSYTPTKGTLQDENLGICVGHIQEKDFVDNHSLSKGLLRALIAENDKLYEQLKAYNCNTESAEEKVKRLEQEVEDLKNLNKDCNERWTSLNSDFNDLLVCLGHETMKVQKLSEELENHGQSADTILQDLK